MIKDTLFYLITGRTTYSDWIIRAVENTNLNNSSALFNDLNARITLDLNRKNKFDASGYFSNDAFRLHSDTTYRYLNNIFSARWRHYFSSTFFSSVTASNSYYRYNISSLRVAEEAFRLYHSINTTGVKADFNYFRGRSEYNFGSEVNFHNVTPGNFYPAGDSSIIIPSSIERQKAVEGALWIEDKMSLTGWLSVNAAIRYSAFSALGPRTIYSYDPRFSRSTITDTISFRGNGSYRNYSGPELRLSANFRINNFSSFKINYNNTRQYLHLLSNTTAISPTDIWKLSDYYLKPQTGHQLAAGFYRILNKNKIEFSAEVYYRKMGNMVDFKGGTNLVMNYNIERDLINVRGKAYGLELLLKKPEGRIRWSAGYTYSRLDLSVKISGTLKSDKIAHPHWIFSIYNVLGRDNVYSAYFKNVNNTVRSYYLSVFAQPIPSLSFNFDF